MTVYDNSADKYKQLQQEVVHLKAEVLKKDRELGELRKQMTTSKATLQTQLQKSEENREDILIAKEKLGCCLALFTQLS